MQAFIPGACYRSNTQYCPTLLARWIDLIPNRYCYLIFKSYSCHSSLNYGYNWTLQGIKPRSSLKIKCSIIFTNNHQMFNVISYIIYAFAQSLTLTPIGRLKVFGIKAMNDEGTSNLNFSQLFTILIIIPSEESAEYKIINWSTSGLCVPKSSRCPLLRLDEVGQELIERRKGIFVAEEVGKYHSRVIQCQSKQIWRVPV